MKGFTLLMLVFVIGFASASSVTCTIVNDKVLVEIELGEDANVILPEKYSLLEENGSTVSFISRDFLREDGEYIFALSRVVDSVYDLKVYLPRNHILDGELVYPKGYEISSNGENIILDWNRLSEEEVIVFYEGVENSYAWFWVGIFVLIVLTFVVFRIQKRRFFEELDRLKKDAIIREKNARKTMVSRNLIGKEKIIVEFLMGRKSCWMKELVRELNISKVMASRKIRSLVEKGIVVKENFGKENKVSLAK